LVCSAEGSFVDRRTFLYGCFSGTNGKFVDYAASHRYAQTEAGEYDHFS